MAPIPDSSENTFTRRRILGWTGAGAISGLTGYWCWPRRHSEATAQVASVSSMPVVTKQPEPDLQAESPSSDSPRPAGTVRREDFLPHLKSEFVLDSGIRCTLIDVGSASKLVSPAAAFTSFSLLFAAPSDSASESKIHHLTHEKLGPMDLFLSPVGRSKQHVHMEAVFSQRV